MSADGWQVVCQTRGTNHVLARDEEARRTVKQQDFCAACGVDTGQCPSCGTFWFRKGDKRYGVGPATRVEGPTGASSLDVLPNVVVR